MTSIENLYYALGEIVYAMAKVDGTVQKEEKDKLHQILIDEFKKHQTNLDITEIAFQILKKDNVSSKTAFDWAVNQLKLNSQYISEKLKADFIAVIVKVAGAFPPVTNEEQDLAVNFIKELNAIKGDPLFCKETE